MPHEIAKLLLEHAGTAIERADAIKSAIYLGMSLQEIEEYLDWLDAVRGPVPQKRSEDDDKQDPRLGSDIGLPK